MGTYPVKINGRSLDYSSIRVKGLPVDESLLIAGLVEINYRDAITPPQIAFPVASGLPPATARGKYVTSSSLVLWREVWDAIISNPNWPDGYSDVLLSLGITFKAPGTRPPGSYVSTPPPRAEVEHELRQASIIEVEDNHGSASTGVLMTKLILNTRYILRAGRCLYPLGAVEPPTVEV